jgi:hypothetical protein
MDLLTIVGNATVDEEFLNDLFDDPLETVKRYGFQLTPRERNVLAQREMEKRRSPLV